jgi:hypothetical protein
VSHIALIARLSLRPNQWTGNGVAKGRAAETSRLARERSSSLDNTYVPDYMYVLTNAETVRCASARRWGRAGGQCIHLSCGSQPW